jgi:sulfite reductase (NADPH) flavoprotein alpha-component
MIPANAPFTPAQQAWLNGLLAGLLGPELAQAGAVADVAAAVPAQTDAAAPPPAAEEDFPWHDPALAIDERMKLAEGRPLERRMMAAMGQLDCGQCGYLCQSYAEAIACGEEKSLSRCAPGGKETSRMLKELVASPQPSAPAVAAAPAVASVPLAPDLPGTALFDGALPLNRDGSEKDTRHVVFRGNASSLVYNVGDTLGVHVRNDPEIADAIIVRLGASPTEDVDCPDGTRRPLREALIEACDIGRPSDLSIEVLASRARAPGEGDRLQALAEGYPGAEPTDADLLDLLMAFPSAQPPVQELVLALSKLEPRLYSIASSPKANPGEVHLTVAAVRYQVRGRARKGVASTFLAERAAPGSLLPVYIKPAHNFGLPKEGDKPIIMIGPGTGIAPFRAFLQERRAIGASGRNWLFFGDQRRDLDFLYRDELEAYQKDGFLDLELAFSRDQAEKVYVQHRMRERAADLWSWLQDGAHVYVCGDAQRMARDVDAALTHIIARHGAMDISAAKAYLAGLTREGRYQRDVY